MAQLRLICSNGLVENPRLAADAERLNRIAQDCMASNNTHAWVDLGARCVWVDSLKGSRAFVAVAERERTGFAVVYRATEAEERAAWSGEGEPHGRVFGGRKTLCHVFCLTIACDPV